MLMYVTMLRCTHGRMVVSEQGLTCPPTQYRLSGRQTM